MVFYVFIRRSSLLSPPLRLERAIWGRSFTLSKNGMKRACLPVKTLKIFSNSSDKGQNVLIEILLGKGFSHETIYVNSERYTKKSRCFGQ